jgi:hypothetical protein
VLDHALYGPAVASAYCQWFARYTSFGGAQARASRVREREHGITDARGCVSPPRGGDIARRGGQHREPATTVAAHQLAILSGEAGNGDLNRTGSGLAEHDDAVLGDDDTGRTALIPAHAYDTRTNLINDRGHLRHASHYTNIVRLLKPPRG